MEFYGIDPGKKGAIALYSIDDNWVSSRELSIDNLMMLTFSGGDDNERHIFIEDVRPFPNDTPQTAWGLGKTVGWIEAAFYQIPGSLTIHYVKPEKWQAKMYKGVNREQSKDDMLSEAYAKHFPECRYTPQYAYAAALIAKYGSMAI